MGGKVEGNISAISIIFNTPHIDNLINLHMNTHRSLENEELRGRKNKVLICPNHSFKLGLKGHNSNKYRKSILKKGKRW